MYVTPSHTGEFPRLATRAECTGCTACFNVCAVGALSLEPDEEGFLRPVIDAAKCIHCGRCTKTCPQINPPKLPGERKFAYACWHRNKEIRNKSSSGGAFTAMAEVVLAKGGVVYGAAFDGLIVRHVRVDSAEGLSRLRRSKYVQSDIGTAFREVKDDIANRIPVLFSGTPCQVAGLYAYLGDRRADLLLTIDFACHGANSPKVFADYIEWAGEKQGSHVQSLEFRNKDLGWHLHEVVATLEDCRIIRERPYDNALYNGFLKHLYLRPSCSRCTYATLSHPADVTLADFWGYKGFSDLDADDNQGVSAVIVNSENGKCFFAEAITNLVVFHRKPEDVSRSNVALRLPSAAATNRTDFWIDYDRLGFSDALVGKYLRTPPDETPPDHRNPKPGMKTMIKRRARKLLKSIFGKKICRFAKRILHAALSRTRNAMKRAIRFFKLRILDRIRLFLEIKRYDCIFVFVSPGHTNLGDNAQMLCIRELLEKQFPKHRILFFTSDYIRETNLGIVSFVKRHSKPDAPVFLHSGYRMSDVWLGANRQHECVVQVFNDRPVISFPQTIYYRDKSVAEHTASIFNAHPNNTLMCRDAVSFETAKQLFPKCKLLLVPDVVTSKIGQYRFNSPRHGILVCKRNDRESACGGEEFARLLTELSRLDDVTVTDTFAKNSWKTMHKDLKRYLENVWEDYAKYRLVVTDRYHGTIFALVAATPVIVIPSTDHKLRSGLDWFPPSFSEYIQFVPNPKDIPAVAEAMLEKHLDYVLPPYFKERYFNDMIENANNWVKGQSPFPSGYRDF